MSDLARLLAAYDDAEEAFLAKAREAAASADGVTGPSQWDTVTECPGWTVGDIVAHVVGVEQELEGLPRPDHELPEGLTHVTSDSGRWMEVQVDLRRGRPPDSVVAELEEILTVRRGTLKRQVEQATASEADPEVMGPFGAAAPLSQLLRLRVFDIWAHEQDIRRAVGEPGHLSGPAADIFAEQIRLALPYVVARKAQLRPGTVVQLWAEGQTVLHAAVLVDADGRGRLLEKDVGLPTVDISMDWETLVRLACGRVAVDEVLPEIALDGSRKAGLAVLSSLSITP